MENMQPQKPLAEVLYEQKSVLPSTSIVKLRVEDHTYIYIINHWNYAGNQFLHDPGCVCLK